MAASSTICWQQGWRLPPWSACATVSCNPHPFRSKTMPQLTFSGVRKSYDRKEVLHGVDLTFRDGEFIVIVGPSGCGKSTLLRMIAGLEDITAGEIAMDGRRLNGVEPSQRGCS